MAAPEGAALRHLLHGDEFRARDLAAVFRQDELLREVHQRENGVPVAGIDGIGVVQTKIVLRRCCSCWTLSEIRRRRRAKTPSRVGSKFQATRTRFRCEAQLPHRPFDVAHVESAEQVVSVAEAGGMILRGRCEQADRFETAACDDEDLRRDGEPVAGGGREFRALDMSPAVPGLQFDQVDSITRRRLRCASMILP